MCIVAKKAGLMELPLGAGVGLGRGQTLSNGGQKTPKVGDF